MTRPGKQVENMMLKNRWLDLLKVGLPWPEGLHYALWDEDQKSNRKSLKAEVSFRT